MQSRAVLSELYQHFLKIMPLVEDDARKSVWAHPTIGLIPARNVLTKQASSDHLCLAVAFAHQHASFSNAAKLLNATQSKELFRCLLAALVMEILFEIEPKAEVVPDAPPVKRKLRTELTSDTGFAICSLLMKLAIRFPAACADQVEHARLYMQPNIASSS